MPKGTGAFGRPDFGQWGNWKLPLHYEGCVHNPVGRLYKLHIGMNVRCAPPLKGMAVNLQCELPASIHNSCVQESSSLLERCNSVQLYTQCPLYSPRPPPRSKLKP